MKGLYANVMGSGPPLLILHGFLGMSDNWKTLGTHYADEGFEVHLIDQRNHGRSFWSEEFNYTVLAEDIKNYMAEHGITSAHVLGHSMGGKTAMQFACTYPEKVISLIVADIAPKYYPPHHDYILNGLRSLSPQDLTSRTTADEALSRHISDWGIRQFLLKNLYWKEKDQLAFRFNLEVLSERMNEIGESIGSTDRYLGPALFIRGSRSEYVQEEDLSGIRVHFPRAILKTVENAGHWLHAENPDQFLEFTLSFLNS
ncbi:Pimeloyl-ACP methyl ester carboxylesterase [Muriicola jejuensis]|uniref:Alpha/beta fold hydrolase n=1 Tax=Muriicola jejuensis TaxID=504488 RepID=A0A6P0UDT4_9FLAO|nr:alpha/beta fold hydrolase [Muriicola jejuensis]NER09423.1 alpha/beta fold hydrolase [Muriicola jejuensis]SMP08757.1 Pimeloyl-ACP methyl ester carboxylesterase [Muriicola jejuensis]